MTLGLSAIGLAKARELAREALVELARGNDPGAAKQERKAASSAAAQPAHDLIETVVEEFIEAHVKRNLKPSTGREIARLLRKETVPWRGRRAGEIRPQDVHRLLDAIIVRGATVAANRIFAAIRRMFRWAHERQIIAASPCEGIRVPTSERGRARDRVLDDGELRLIWEATSSLGFPFGPMIWLLILTGQRRSEVAGMRWGELDIDAGLWSLPSFRCRNHRPHQVPLSPPAVEILRSLPRFESSQLVLSPGTRRLPASADAKLALIAPLRRQMGGNSFRPGSCMTFAGAWRLAWRA